MIFFCDIDGTIVDAMKGIEKPSDKTVYAFNELSKDNIIFLASGRMKCLLDDEIRELNAGGYLLGNGSYADYNGELIVSKLFSLEDTKRIMDYCHEIDAAYFIEYIDCLYTADEDNECFKWLYDNWKPLRTANITNEMIDENIYMIMSVVNNEKEIDGINERFSDVVDVVPHATGRSLDINVKNVSKGTAVKEILEYFNIDPKDAYAFGDGNNDIEMFGEVGHSVAMGNANDYVKSFAKEVTDNVEDDGFYNYLVKNKLIKPMD